MGRSSPPRLEMDEPTVFVPESRMPEVLRDAEAEAGVVVEEDWVWVSARRRRPRGRADRSIFDEAG